MPLFFLHGYSFGIVIILQVICAVHCLRSGQDRGWLWIIIFLPLVGTLIYFFTVLFTSRQLKKMQDSLGSAIHPAGSIRKLEANVRFSDTFANRVALADALLAKGETQRAITIYNDSLTGTFSESEHVLAQLSEAYFRLKQYDDVIRVTSKIKSLPQFPRSRAHLHYAISLGYTGQTKAAEAEFQRFKSRFANFEGRYEYGMFLIRQERTQEARELFTTLREEFRQLGAREKRFARSAVRKASRVLRTLTTASPMPK